MEQYFLSKQQNVEMPQEEIKEEIKRNFTQWTKQGDLYIGTGSTIPTLEAGRYTVGYNQDLGIYLKPFYLKTNKLFKLTNNVSETLFKDMEKFWGLKDTYAKYNKLYKRNYLLYSAPGTGKTSLINLMCQRLIEEYNGVVIYVNGEREMDLLTTILRTLRDIEPERKVIVVMEDIDNVMMSDYAKSLLLNILDGYLTTDNMVTIATTNYIERIDSRIKNRPSRFNRVVEFPLPNAEDRKVFITNSILPEDLEKINIKKWVEKTEGFTIDHINELIQLFFVFGEDEDYSFNTVQNMVNNNDNLINEDSVQQRQIGFRYFDNKYNDKDEDCDYTIIKSR